MTDTIGIIGAGKLGTTLARLAVDAGCRVLISASGAPDRIALTIDVLAPGAEPVSTAELVRRAPVIVLALPLHRLHTLPTQEFAGKIVFDATNYWAPVDGVLPPFEDRSGTTSEVVQNLLPGAHIVKTFSHLGYHDLDQHPHPAGTPDRLALGIAGDDPDSVTIAADLIDRVGFDPVPIGPLGASGVLETGGPIFGRLLTAPELLAHLDPALTT